jgi:hypothetical protein
MSVMTAKPHVLNRAGVLTSPLALVVALAASPAGAATALISSSSYALGVDLTVNGTPFTAGPLVTAFGSAPAQYSVTDVLPSEVIPGLLSTGGLLGAAVISPDPSTPIGAGFATVDDLFLSLGVFNLSATTITSDSFVSGLGSPKAAGISNVLQLTLSGGLLGTSITFSGIPPANDVIFNSGGLKITLNQQTPDVAETAGITTDALVVDFTAVPFGPNVVNGDVVVSSSEASITVVPEPASWIEMLLGFGAVGFLMRGRAKAKAAA